MLITRKSMISGAIRTRNIPVEQKQIDDWLSGTLIQDAMPNLSVDDREFLISGIIPEEWNATFKGSEE